MTNPLSRFAQTARPKENPRAGPNVSGHGGRGSLAGDSINSIIESDIIPRLLMAHSTSAPNESRARAAEIDASAANLFSALPLELEAAGLLEKVDAFLAAGVSVEAIYLDLLAPSARRLGEMWETDECDFIDVTMGLWRLQEVMRDISARTPVREAASCPDAKKVLFGPMPGDQHSFGAQMLDEIFARSGWNSTFLAKPLRKELLDTLSHKSFDVVGLTLSRDCPSAAIANLIKAMRNASSNPDIFILLGGHTINQNPAIVAEVGADGTGTDARAALNLAQRLVESSAARSQITR